MEVGLVNNFKYRLKIYFMWYMWYRVWYRYGGHMGNKGLSNK